MKESKRTMDCQELVELVTVYLEDAFAAQAKARFETHVSECGGCAHYVDQMKQTVHTLGELSIEELDPALRDRILADFRRRC
ncbi:anti-sigma factor family protein [Rhodococcus koreensis]|uniref:anti-sigma factor family protein n=1 Tax=Rhodococcus koreensis TaxID=99653 RepID=UPI003671F57E